MKKTNSEQLYLEAKKHIVGGVNSPSRSFKAVGGGAPIFMQRAQGAYLWDVDQNRYIDYLAAYGPIITGHAHPHIVEAICEAAKNGTLYGTPTELEIHLAKMLKDAIPSMDKVRFVNSGTEAVMSTIRVARAFTKRDKIIKFSGCYHGHSDAVLVAAGSGPSTLGVPDSAGVPISIAQEVITVPFNDLEALQIAFEQFSDQIAAVLIEPIVGNFGIVSPQHGYLQKLCQITRAHGALVIYDEVITAFRFHYGGAQNYTKLINHQVNEIEPDLTILGKIIGGGLPIGAYGGREAVMEQVAPIGLTYQAGTASGNCASMRAGIACLQILQKPEHYQILENLASKLANGILDLSKKYHIDLTVNRVGGAFSTHFCNHPVTNYAEAENTDAEQFAHFFRLLLEQGICIAPSRYEAWFLTIAHQEVDIATTLHAVEHAFQKMSASFTF